MIERSFAFHGVHLALLTDSERLAENLVRDFSYFHRPGAAPPDITVQAWLRPPPWDLAPAARSVLVQPTCVVYEHQGTRWVDYQGRALCRWRHADETGELWSEDFDLLYEVSYLLILSRVGELHDRRGIHRVHALGLAVGGRGVLCLLPSGGGKTSLGLRVLRDNRARLLSDDTPLVTRRGELLPFPNRIGCAERPDVPEKYLRTFARRDHGDKWIVDVEAFAGTIGESARPHAIVLGARQLQGAARIERIPRWQALGELFRSVVVGLGLPQVVEYFLRFDRSDLAGKAAIVASRTLACSALLARAATWRLHLGRDHDDNARRLREILESISG